MTYRTFRLLGVLPLLWFLGMGAAFAESGDVLPVASGPSSILMEQKNKGGVLGEWTILFPSGKEEKGTSSGTMLSNVEIGQYTIFAESPEGATASISIYSGESLLLYVPRPQTSFTVEEGVALHITIEYRFTRIGVVAVNSTPPGLSFTLKGPNESVFIGVTPVSFTEAPKGQYTVEFDAIEGCVPPKPKSDLLVAGGRISLSIDIVCDLLERRKSYQEEQKKDFLTMSIEGKDVIFLDVPLDAWYTHYIFEAMKRGILSGYRNEAGEPTGEYGPGNSVTIAELAKIAHKIADLDETSVQAAPFNPLALGEWFEPFFASAESLDWLVFADGEIDPLKPATRAEVLVTLLQALNIPLNWPTGELFTDVTRRTEFAAAIETAAVAGIVSGYNDDEGNPTGLFGPADPVNRAEMAKIINLVVEKYVNRNER